jgi:hypothetical protein
MCKKGLTQPQLRLRADNITGQTCLNNFSWPTRKDRWQQLILTLQEYFWRIFWEFPSSTKQTMGQQLL